MFLHPEISEGRVKQPKTKGLEWLYLSMASFNGSGYADKSSPETYINSYAAFKRMKKLYEALEVLTSNMDAAYLYAEKLIDAEEAGHKPSQKNYDKFLEYYSKENLL